MATIRKRIPANVIMASNELPYSDEYHHSTAQCPYSVIPANAGIHFQFAILALKSFIIRIVKYNIC